MYFQDSIYGEILEGSRFIEPDSIVRGLVQWGDIMDKVLQRFIKKKVRLNMKKFVFIDTKIRYCVEHLKKGTYSYEPEL
eukprot:snap_masked-scaffold_23-processed-gene-0.21-mRNA-1 protein AED:1.00 eAED:1.00 QI:0/0/0/0/1/1/2/0/78